MRTRIGEIVEKITHKQHNYKQGWYTICDMDFLTRSAIMKHFNISQKTFDEIIATTREGGVNEDKVGTDTKINQHNGVKNSRFTTFMICVSLLQSRKIK
ncbi:MAG: hypothetical protein WC325_01695 [Candidatus Bathyarchaeia archaeon]|jgi:hypothetical protein